MNNIKFKVGQIWENDQGDHFEITSYHLRLSGAFEAKCIKPGPNSKVASYSVYTFSSLGYINSNYRSSIDLKKLIYEKPCEVKGSIELITNLNEFKVPKLGHFCHTQGGIYAGVISNRNIEFSDYHIICAPPDNALNPKIWVEAMSHVNSMFLNGFADWSLPTGRESILLAINVPEIFSMDCMYWTADKTISPNSCLTYAKVIDFYKDKQYEKNIMESHKSLPIRRILSKN